MTRQASITEPVAPTDDIRDDGDRYPCGGAAHGVTRRRVLATLGGAGMTAAGGLGGVLGPVAAGLPLGTVSEARGAQMRKAGKQVLLVWIDGGMSQLETWDPKPDSPFGGPFRTIPTSVPGLRVCELMPHTARQVHRMTVVRSMQTQDENHSTGVGRMQRGDPKARGVDYPFLGSAVAKLVGAGDSGLPAYISVKPGSGGFLAGEAGFLGARFAPLALGDGKPPVHLRPPAGMTDEAAAARERLRLAADARFRRGRRDAELDAYESSFASAEQLVRRSSLFDESELPARDVGRYGRHPLGRHLLLARRLLEAGTTFVKVTSYHWDTHGDNFEMHRQLVPQLDRPLAALMEDLDAAGLLQHVVVVVMSEFGRTPKINSRLGRDHWPGAWSLALAGAGIRRGAVVGATSADGAWIDEAAHDVGHLFHTVFAALGIDAHQAQYDNNGQPLPVARDDCDVIPGVLV